MKIKRSIGLFSCAVAALLFLIAGASSAHAQVANGAIVGTVTDASGGAIPGATVTVTNPATGISQAAQTGVTGDYTFNLLQLGTYNVAVAANGFQRYLASGITLSPGARVRVNAKLAVGTQTQSVEVSAAASPLLQTETSAVSTNLGAAEVQNLPIEGRNYMNLVTLSAGVTSGLPGALSSGTRPDDRRQSSSYAANGLSDIANNNLIDGMDNNERFIGTIGIRPAPDAIEQVKVMTGNYTAAVGRSAGGVVDLVTKSGTNQFHGSLFEYLGNDVLDARDFFSATKPQLRLKIGRAHV